MIDTAGIRESDDEIEREGIAMTRGQLAKADLVLEVRDLSGIAGPSPLDLPDGVKHLQIYNKLDLIHDSWKGTEGLRISCETGEGFKEMEEGIAKLLELDDQQWGDHSVAVNARHQACLIRARKSLEKAIVSMRAGEEPELTALDLREALTAIGGIAGVVDTEEILGEIFGRFCIGK
ncbi:MAG: tRNA modification GTPase [Akkermansiaceae bacterium]